MEFLPYSLFAIGELGAGSGIGCETSLCLVREGAHIVCMDINAAAAQSNPYEILAKTGLGIGADITKRESIAAMLQELVLHSFYFR